MSRVRAKVDVTGGSIAGTSITGSYQTVLSSIQGRGVVLVFGNSCNTDLVVSLDGGTTNWMILPAGFSPVLDFGSNDVEFSGSVSIKHNGVGPASGTFAVGVIRSE
jgi:hypothetical protein